MIIEYYKYHAFVKTERFSLGKSAKLVPVPEVVSLLPKDLKAQLLAPPNKLRAPTFIVEATEDLSSRMDEFLSDKFTFSKVRKTEITEDEIDRFRFFFIDVKSADWGKSVFFESTKPICGHETCPYGSKIISDVIIDTGAFGKSSLARVVGPYQSGVLFLIENRLKWVFEQSKISGLEFRKRELTDRAKQMSGYSLAAITTSYTKIASGIRIRDYCQKHLLLIDGTPLNTRYPSADLSEADFQMVNRIKVGEREYFLRSPWFFVSVKALKVLLHNDPRDVRSMASFIKNGFTPVPFD